MSRSPHYSTGLVHKYKVPTRRRTGMRPVARRKDGMATMYSVQYRSPQRRFKRPAEIDVASAVYGASQVSTSFAFRAVVGVLAVLALFWGLFNGIQFVNATAISPWLEQRALASRGYDDISIQSLMNPVNADLKDAYLAEDKVNHSLMTQLEDLPGFNLRLYAEYQEAHKVTADIQATIGYAVQVVSAPGYNSELGPRYHEVIQNLDQYDYADETAAGAVQYVGLRLDGQAYSDPYLLQSPSSLTALVDKRHRLAEDYLPSDMRSVDPGDGPDYVRLRPEAAKAVEDMFDSARNSGLDFFATSGYRSYFAQSRIYDQRVAEEGQDAADEFSARPGFSEHQTGLAVDVVARNSRICNLLIVCFSETRNYDWMLDNAHRFGFIQSYSEENQWVTDYGAEAWHWRYIGVEAATEMRQLEYQSFQQYAFDKSLIR